MGYDIRIGDRVIGLASRERHQEFTEFASVVTSRLFRSALLLCGDWQLSEDLVQTTLAKLYVAWPKVRKADSAEAYAHGTLTKTFLSHKRVRRNSEAPTDLVTHRPAQHRDLDLHVDLFAALAALDKADRTVVVLRYWEDWSVADTAHHMHLSEAAVRTRSSRAMAKLRESLTPAKGATA
jgi:RNA polymerase sigma-70 factor (sigma-E family)